MKSAAALVLLAVLGFAFLQGCGKQGSEKSSQETVGDAIKAEESEKQPSEMEARTVTLTIEGMTCEHCVNTITRTLEGCAGIASVKVDLASGEALVMGDQFDTDALSDAVKEVGYKVVEMKGQ